MTTKAEELADKVTAPTAGPWDSLEAAEELRRLSSELTECKAAYESQFKELHALKASIGEPVGGYWWNTESLQTKMIEKGQVWTASDKWVFIGSLYAIKDNHP